jgi:hypothetical protein
MNVGWKVYAEQGHWYKVPDTIDDIVQFLERTMLLEGRQDLLQEFT